MPLGRDRTVSSGMRPMSAPTATPAPQDESPMRAFWPQAQFPPNFVLLTYSVQINTASPLPYALSGLDYAPLRKFLYFCVPNLLASARLCPVPNFAPAVRGHGSVRRGRGAGLGLGQGGDL